MGSTPAARPTSRPRRAAPEAELEVVEAGSLAMGVMGVGVFAFIFASLLGMVVFQTLLIQGQLDLDQIDRSIEVQGELRRELELEVARLESPDRILAAAELRFGMIPPVERLPLDPVVVGSAGDLLPAPGPDPFGLIQYGTMTDASLPASPTSQPDPASTTATP